MTKQINLKNLKYATKQQIFDQVAAHLLKQMRRSTRSENVSSCMYRGANGLKCAAGILIDDNEYKDKMEGRSWIDLVEFGIVPIRNFEFIRELQILHDSKSVYYWPDLLRLLAKKYKLKCNF